MRDIDILLRRLGNTEPGANGVQVDAEVMSRIALLSPANRSDGLLRWGGMTAMAGLVVGTMSGSVFAAPRVVSSTAAPFSVGVALAPSTLLASAP